MPGAEEEPAAEEAAEEQSDTFAFDVPAHAKKGATLKLAAPDGVTLHIPMGDSIFPGDRVCMEKASSGKWGLKQIIRSENPAITVEASGQVTQRGDAQLEADLADSQTQLVKLRTTKGDICLRIVPSWAPRGAQRFLTLVTNRYYSDLAIYRAVPKFLIQFGVVNDPERNSKYDAITDDLLRGVPIVDGSVCFAAAGPDTRTATICIFLGEYPQLGSNPWETPIGKVCPESMGVLRSIFTGYGDMPQCGGAGPDPIQLEEQGNDYITENFPRCDFVRAAEWMSA